MFSVPCWKFLFSIFLLSSINSELPYNLFSHPSPSVLIPALRTVGNIVTGDDMQTQVLLAFDLFNAVFSLVDVGVLQMKNLNKCLINLFM